MPKFGTVSRTKLNTCHADLQRLFEAVVRDYDCTILEGHRSRPAQNAAYASGNSRVRWPDGKHNSVPSEAVDVAPWPIPKNWDPPQFYFFAGVVMEKARSMGLEVRWGGDWDQDGRTDDQTFNDLVHFELV